MPNFRQNFVISKNFDRQSRREKNWDFFIYFKLLGWGLEDRGGYDDPTKPLVHQQRSGGLGGINHMVLGAVAPLRLICFVLSF